MRNSVKLTGCRLAPRHCRCDWQEMKEFHTEEYIDFLLHITPDNMHEMAHRMKQHNVGFVGQYDCPVFDLSLIHI